MLDCQQFNLLCNYKFYPGTQDWIQTQFELQGRESDAKSKKSKKKKKKKPGKGTFLLSGLALGALATHVLKKPNRPSYNSGYQSARPSYNPGYQSAYPPSYNQPLLHHTGTPYPHPQYQQSPPQYQQSPPQYQQSPIYSNPTSYVSSTSYSPSSSTSYYPSTSSSYSSFPSTSSSYPTSTSTTYINHPSSYPSRPTSYPHYGKTEYGSPQTLVPVFIY